MTTYNPKIMSHLAYVLARCLRSRSDYEMLEELEFADGFKCKYVTEHYSQVQQMLT